MDDGSNMRQDSLSRRTLYMNMRARDATTREPTIALDGFLNA